MRTEGEWNKYGNYFSSVASGYALHLCHYLPGVHLSSCLHCARQSGSSFSPISITFVFASSNFWNIICITYSFLYFTFHWNTEIYTESKSTLESLNERRIIDICKILQKLSKLESVFLRILIIHRWG